jgi:hypothetical protein
MASGKCIICGRTLTNPISIEREMGPVCYARHLATLKWIEEQMEQNVEHEKVGEKMELAA